jgi:hypothetical protein
MIKKYLVDSIDYDTDGQPVEGLPSQLTITLELTEEDLEHEDLLEELLSDAISEETGWCVNGFNYEEIGHKVFVVVREDTQAFVATFQTRRGAEKFLENFRVAGEIIESEVVEDPNE